MSCIKRFKQVCEFIHITLEIVESLEQNNTSKTFLEFYRKKFDQN